jgi:GH43 family beta-xylosidase
MNLQHVAETYTNPVYPEYFADPFVLRHNGAYYAYGTGNRPSSNGRVFEVLFSTDLTQWHSLGAALEPLGAGFEDYWAPEVAHADGRFYLYYSAGIGDQHHRLRVAVSERPEGPFIDSGTVLTPDEPFSIDASPFCDDDGQWYLYYARDFLDGERLGTALTVAKLENMMRLSGESITVLRASQDWQLYARDREMYGRRLEGPFVVKRGGRYYCFYSGGAWPEPNYGVSFAVADHPLGPWLEPEGDGPKILQTVPERVIGPGHNSVIVGPDDQDYIVYHAWDPARTARRMCIDRLEWTPKGPRTDGPSFTPQRGSRPARFSASEED